VRFDTAQLRADGTLAAIDFSLAPVLGDDGRPQYLFAEGVDISAQVEAQRALAHSQVRNAELLELLDDAPDGYYVIDARSHRFLWVNGGARRNLGYAAEELAGMTCADLSPELDAPRLCELLAPLERGEVDEVKLETEHVRKDGSRYPIDVRYARGHYRGEPALFAVVAETSERRRLEAQLLQAQKLEALGTLAGGVAHDFNNLLTSMRGSAELLLRQAEPGGPVERAARRVLMAADRGQQLTAQLLAYSRPAAQRSEPIDLSGAVREAHELLARTVGEDIRFELSLAGDLWPVVADPGQINQVLVNLIVNARDSMAGGGTLSIGTANARLDASAAGGLDLEPGDYVRVTLRDTGKGMSPEVQARIFDPFFTTKGPGKGTGLGLATVLAIVQRHGGRIGVESQEGRGTRFDIWLPRAPEGAALAGAPGAILVLVRDAILRDLVSELLEDRGYPVHASASLDEAARSAAPDLLIADASFGPELLAGAIRGRAKRALYLASDDGRGTPGLEDANLLAKPFTNEALLTKVRELLGR
jgi:PAS domain S-box-containing protein